jgi:hypothetical protein
MISVRCDGARDDRYCDRSQGTVDFAALWFLEQYEVLSDEQSVTDLSDQDSKAVEILNTLRDTVDAIPP